MIGARTGARGRAMLALACLGLASMLCSPAGAAPPPPPPPSVNGVNAYEVTISSALLVGYVNPRGVATSYYFEYGTTNVYGTQTPTGPAGGGSSEVRVSAVVTGLASGTTYHYRMVAVSASGARTGPDHVFTTVRIPLSYQLAASQNPVALGGALSIQGTLSGSGSAGRELELQMNPFPYAAGMMRYGSPITTDAAGHFSFAVAGLLENAHFRVVTVGAPVVASPLISEGVAVRVVLHARRAHSHRRGKLYRLYGTVIPADVGAHVVFQLLRPGGSTVKEGGARVKRGSSTSSRFSATVRIRHPGLYEALVTVTNGRNVAGYSAPVRIR
jgi:hypothetical protein